MNPAQGSKIHSQIFIGRWNDRRPTPARDPYSGKTTVTMPQVMATMSGVDVATYTRQGPGVSTFVLEDGNLYHTYSTYARGLDAFWGMYQWLDRAPKGRNETGVWFRRHDEYDKR